MSTCIPLALAPATLYTLPIRYLSMPSKIANVSRLLPWVLLTCVMERG